MAVKTFCSMCNKEIATITGEAIRNLTGKEICTGCSEHLKQMRAGMEKEKEDFLKEITDLKVKVGDKYKDVMHTLGKYENMCTSLYATRQTEIDNRLKDLLK